MEKLALKLEPRTVVGKKVKHLRTQGLVPASICGKGVTPENFVADAKTFGRVYQQAGKTGLIELQTPTAVLQGFIRQIQRHPLSSMWLHVDFHVVDLRVEITSAVPVVAVGENELVTKQGGLISIMHNTLQVRALPMALPQNIEVDISGITDYSTNLYVRDVQVGPGVEILTPGDDPLITITQSSTALEEAAIVEQEQLGEPELTGDEGLKDINDPSPATPGAEKASQNAEE